ncbi:IGEB protein, partial [Loxia leucoptera]|nr:IGEB protein [Loxia leucoptera]
IEHKTGIPYSPTGQAMVERAHQRLKKVLHQQRGAMNVESPQVWLSKALFTLNFLNCTYENLNPPITRHSKENSQYSLKAHLPILIKDPETWKTEGPYELV